MGFWFGDKTEFAKELEKQIAPLVREVATLKAERDARRQVADLEATETALRKQISSLEIDKAKKIEEFERREREVKHDTGLLRKQVEHDTKMAIERAKLEVEQGNLKTEREAFVKEMKFREERWTQEQKYLKDLMGQILERLPNVEEHVSISTGSGSKAKAAAKSE